MAKGLKIGDRQDEGAPLASLGAVYKDLGQYQKALDYHQQALAITRKIGDHNGESNNLTNIGLLYKDLGQYPKALDYYQQALAITRKIGDHNGESNNLTNIGLVYEDLSQYPKALEYHEQALTIAQKIGVPMEKQEANIGDLHLQQGEYAKALAIYKRIKWTDRLGHYYLKIGEYSTAQRFFANYLQNVDKKSTDNLIAVHIDLGLAAEGLADYDQAQYHYRKAIALIESQRRQLTPAQRQYFFQAKVMGFSRLTPYEGMAHVLYQQKQAAEGFYWSENTKARVLLEALAKKNDDAIQPNPNALDLMEEIVHTGLEPVIEYIQSVAKQRQCEMAFKSNCEFLAKQAAWKKEVTEQQWAAYITRLRQAQPEYAAMQYPEPIRVKDLKLAPNEVLIAYEVTDSTTLVWLIKGKAVLKTQVIPIERKALTEQVKHYRRFFEDIAANPTAVQMAAFDPQAGQALYRLLLADLVPYLTPGDRLIIIPDEILGVLPFETLVVETPEHTQRVDGPYGPSFPGVRYLGEVYPIQYYQSATTLMLNRTLHTGPAGQRPALVVADPVFELADVRAVGTSRLAQRHEPVVNIMRAMEDYEGGGLTFPRLAQTGRLVEKLRQLHNSGVDALTGLDASEPKLRQLPLANYRYQVFGTHGVLDSDVPGLKQPALVLNQIGTNALEPAQDGFLTMTEVMDLKMNAEVAALIACNTGMGRDLRGDGVQHMGRAFQYAGARSVLISLWSVAEKATVLLTERFFAHLKAGYNRIAALRLAQQDLRNADYRHPFYWSSFILVGERGVGKAWQPGSTHTAPSGAGSADFLSTADQPVARLMGAGSTTAVSADAGPNADFSEHPTARGWFLSPLFLSTTVLVLLSAAGVLVLVRRRTPKPAPFTFKEHLRIAMTIEDRDERTAYMKRHNMLEMMEQRNRAARRNSA